MMPNKMTHDLALVSMATGVILSLPANGVVVFPIAAGMLAGIALSPDLDVANRRPRTVWNMYWWLYSKLIPHRDSLSHMPLISTMIRLIYLPVIPVYAWLSSTGHVSELGEWIFKWCVVGLALADCLHTILDIAFSYWRNR